jgi:hypothetical protein
MDLGCGLEPVVTAWLQVQKVSIPHCMNGIKRSAVSIPPGATNSKGLASSVLSSQFFVCAFVSARSPSKCREAWLVAG